MTRKFKIHYNRVKSDRAAFARVRARIEGDVGSLIELIRLGQKNGHFNNTAPFWSLARMLFPIVESLGCLLLRGQSTSANLKYGLEHLNAEYKGISAIISLVYRHSLMHQDELRTLRKARTSITWNLRFDSPNEHLIVTKFGRGLYEIKFDLTKFYQDILSKLKELENVYFKKQVQKEYNSWLLFKLSGNNRIERDAISELSAIRKKYGR